MKLSIQRKTNGKRLHPGNEGETDQELEGNWYFASEAVDMTHLNVINRTYTCPYKGTCF